MFVLKLLKVLSLWILLRVIASETKLKAFAFSKPIESKFNRKKPNTK